MATGTVEIRAEGTEETREQIESIGEAARGAAAELEQLRELSRHGWEGEIRDGVARFGTARVVREPLTYDARLERSARGGLRVCQVGTEEPRSYFHDIYLSSRGDLAARERLERHGREMEVESRKLDRLAPPPPEVESDPGGPESRVTTTSYAVPPAWLIRYFAEAPRPARVLADLAPGFRLPKGAGTINLPRASQTSSETDQQLGTPAPSTDVIDNAVTSNVATIAGDWDVPLQMLEQSPQGAHFDWVAFQQLAYDYDAALETQLITGSGAGNALLGILNNTAIPAATNVVNYFSAAPLATSLFTFLGQVVAAVGNQRLLPPERWLIRTNRFAWLGSSEDSQNRPLMITDKDGSGEFDLLGITVEQDNAIPMTLGGSGNQDVMICCRPSDWLVLEAMQHVDTFPEPLSGTLEVRFSLRGYVAALLRQPTSVSYVQGTGMARPSGF